MTGTNPVLFKRFDIDNIPSGPFTCNFLDIKLSLKQITGKKVKGLFLNMAEQRK